MLESTRIDKWLWAARFYKTRSMASKAVDGGRVHINGSRVKAAHKVKINDLVQISRDHVKQEFQVLGIAERRGAAAEAQLLYVESVDSVARREQVQLQRKILNQGIPQSVGKPNKHDRRRIREIIGKS
jgi:ribosome-associated heat shock protein Hsp15|tara:strand:+ start:21865 stop:22248 length:384 start_codon:yes stop_codon:yes gene_type:complete